MPPGGMGSAAPLNVTNAFSQMNPVDPSVTMTQQAVPLTGNYSGDTVVAMGAEYESNELGVRLAPTTHPGQSEPNI